MSIDECLDVLSKVGKNEEYVGEVVKCLHTKPKYRLRKLATMAYHGSRFTMSQSHGHVIVNGQIKTWEEIDNC
jgi:hypothetical protein